MFRFIVKISDLFVYVYETGDVYIVAKTSVGRQIEVLKLDRNLTRVFGIITGDLLQVNSFSVGSLDLCDGRLFLSIDQYGIAIFDLYAYIWGAGVFSRKLIKFHSYFGIFKDSISYA